MHFLIVPLLPYDGVSRPHRCVQLLYIFVLFYVTWSTCLSHVSVIIDTLHHVSISGRSVFMCYNESEQFQSKTFFFKLFSIIFSNVSRTNKVVIWKQVCIFIIYIVFIVFGLTYICESTFQDKDAMVSFIRYLLDKKKKLFIIFPHAFIFVLQLMIF